jgi:hypothetical protein
MPALAMAAPADCALTIGWSDRGSRLRWAKEEIDDRDKLPPFCVTAPPRRSTSSLDTLIEVRSSICSGCNLGSRGVVPAADSRLARRTLWLIPLGVLSRGLAIVCLPFTIVLAYWLVGFCPPFRNPRRQ